MRGATKSHKFKLLPLFVWTVLRHDYSKTVTATLLKGVLERVFHSANVYFSQKQKQEKSFKTLVTAGTARWRVLEFDTLHDIVPFEVSLLD